MLRPAIALTLLVSLPLLAFPLLADEWRSSRNGPAQTGVSETILSGDLQIRWEKDAVDGVVTTAAISNGRVYAGTLSGDFWCLDLVSGDEIWTASTEADKTGFRAGFNSSPTVTDDTVYVGDEDGIFYAIDRSDGSIRWKKTTDDQIVGGATITMIDGVEHVLLGSHDGNLYCVQASDGEQRWAFLTDGPVNCSVALAESDGKMRTFVAGCDEQLRVVDVTTGEEVGHMPLGSPLIASPAVDGSMLYVGTYAGEFAAIDWTKLEASWTVAPDRSGQPIHSSAAVTNSHVIVGGRDRHLRAFDRSTGDELWAIATRSKIDASPVVSGKRAYVGTGDKRVLGVGLVSGEVEWEYDTGRAISAGPAIAEGVMVIGTEGPRGRLICFEQR